MKIPRNRRLRACCWNFLSAEFEFRVPRKGRWSGSWNSFFPPHRTIADRVGHHELFYRRRIRIDRAWESRPWWKNYRPRSHCQCKESLTDSNDSLSIPNAASGQQAAVLCPQGSLSPKLFQRNGERLKLSPARSHRNNQGCRDSPRSFVRAQHLWDHDCTLLTEEDQ